MVTEQTMKYEEGLATSNGNLFFSEITTYEIKKIRDTREIFQNRENISL